MDPKDLGPVPEEDLASEGELVPEDDRVIGRAVRRSLAVVLALGLAGAGFYLYRHRQPEAGPETKIAPAPPKEKAAAATVPEIPFTDVTAAWGVGFTQENGAYGEKLLPESMGSGVAAFDYDADGDADLLFVNAQTWPWRPAPARRATYALYRNDGPGKLTDVSAAAGLTLSYYGTGVACGDFDGDGWTDLLLTGVGGNRLLRNVKGRFTDVTRKAGVGGQPTDWTTAAAFFDADGDGDLDLYVGHYVRWSKDIDHKVDYRLTGVGRAYGPPTNYEGTDSRLYRNDGGGTFTDVTERSGIAVKNPATDAPMGKALGVAPVDADGDGKIDLFVANDTAANFFFKNKSTPGEISFEEIGSVSGVAFDRMGNATGAMGIDSGHLRNDQELGLAIGNFANEMTSLYISQGDPTLYADEAITEGIGAPSRRALKFGILLLDLDLDGRLDLLQTNGHLEEEIPKVDPSQSYRQSAQLFWNAGDARPAFVELPSSNVKDLAKPIVGRGSAAADLDGDGDLDVVMTQVGGKPLVLRNDQKLGHAWLRLKLAGSPPNREALGAWVEVKAGGVTQRRQVMPTRSYFSQSELPVTIGLGPAAKVDSVKVRWPDGKEESFAGVEPNRLTVLEQGKGQG